MKKDRIKLMSAVVSLLGWGCAMMAGAGEPQRAELVAKVPVDRVWSGHPVGFAFQAHKGRLYAAYYDADRRMMIASCAEASPKNWTRQALPQKLGWDSHNYVTFTFDDRDDIHLSGNMHCHPLVYYRTAKPLDLTSFERVPQMVGTREKRCTYPQFMRGAAKELIFHYRDGGSGNGDEIYNVYDASKKQWSRLLDRPLSDGKGEMNAYFAGPKLGPDGWFHLAWVWRDNPKCETNHNLSYMRSRDLCHWETVAGQPVVLPVSLETPDLVVVPTARSHSGLINVGVNLGFDAEKRVIITYHKYDARGFSQIYNTRYENGMWVNHQATDWDWRWEFSGCGSVVCEVIAGAVFCGEGGKLAQTFRTLRQGNSTLTLDPVTLKVGAPYQAKSKDRLPSAVKQLEGKFPGLERHTIHVKSDTPGVHYYFTWETLGPNRDRPWPQPWPEPSNLTLWVVRGNL